MSVPGEVPWFQLRRACRQAADAGPCRARPTVFCTIRLVAASLRMSGISTSARICSSRRTPMSIHHLLWISDALYAHLGDHVVRKVTYMQGLHVGHRAVGGQKQALVRSSARERFGQGYARATVGLWVFSSSANTRAACPLYLPCRGIIQCSTGIRRFVLAHCEAARGS